MRDATGLVRAVSVWDAFLYNNWTCGGAWSSLMWISVYPVWFPQANILLAMGITVVMSIFTGAVYALAVTTMPRSASDYVFVSRSLTPAIGLGFGAINVFWFLIINSWNVYVPFTFFSQTMFSIGAMTGSASLLNGWVWFSSQTSLVLLLGLGILALSIVAIMFGLRTYMRTFQRSVNIVSAIAFVIILFYFLSYTNQDFIARFTQYMSPLSGTPDPYHDIINLATSLGYVPPSGFDWNQTMAVAVLWWFISLGTMGSAWIGGEVKQASNVKAQIIAMMGASVFTYVIADVFEYLWFRVFDKNWLAALGYIVNNYPNKVPAWISPAAPYWGAAWVNFMIGNVPLALIVSLAWVLQGFAVITPLMLMASRQLFAFSFDRVIPSKFSEVHERFSSPILSVIFIGIIMMVGFIFTVYTTWINFAVAAPMGVLYCTLTLSIASIVFYKRKESIYALSPAARLKALGLPLQPLIGVLSAIGILVGLVYYFGPLNGLALGGVAIPVTAISIGLFVAGALGYYVARAVQLKKGVDIAYAFKQIPPE